MKASFFYRPKPKKFEFKPRYYDKNKEERENREKRIKKEIENEAKEGKNYVSLESELHKKWKRNDRDKLKQKSIRRAIIYILLLLMILYVMFHKF